MRSIGIAIVMGGLVIGTSATVAAQDLAVATPGPKSEFVVFADKDGRTLSPTAQNIVRKAAHEASGGDKVVLIGRAEETAAVKAVLESHGVSNRAIVVRHEARAPIARPADGLSDPLDRRVEIRL